MTGSRRQKELLRSYREAHNLSQAHDHFLDDPKTPVLCIHGSKKREAELYTQARRFFEECHYEDRKDHAQKLMEKGKIVVSIDGKRLDTFAKIIIEVPEKTRKARKQKHEICVLDMVVNGLKE